jgi:hypothetical protein
MLYIYINKLNVEFMNLAIDNNIELQGVDLTLLISLSQTFLFV